MSSSQGYYGSGYDRYQAHNEQSTMHKMKETYWTTKQVVLKKMGKREDQHIVASDKELDSKLEQFKAIQKSCMDLLRCLEKYQDRLCALSQEENGMGRFLKSNSQQDKTRAGKMMAAVGKSLSFSSQQRLSLRVPLVRLYQEVETFRYRAISDTLLTIHKMEGARTEYRGALLWMKNVSEQLDPDTHKQLEKFRKVQAQVRKTKARFDRLKLDTMQKVDLLSASRCNMFSHVLANYQTTLLHFWSKTSHTMSAVADSFKGYQYYEFNMLKELCEPTKKLADETGGKETAKSKVNGEKASGDDDEEDEDRLEDADSDLIDRLINFDTVEEGRDAAAELEGNGSMTNLLGNHESTKTGRQDTASSFFDFGEDDERSIEEIKKKQNEEFDQQFVQSIEGKKNTKARQAEARKAQAEKDTCDNCERLSEPAASKTKKSGAECTDLLSGDYDDTDKDDMTLLNEILNAAPSTGEDDFALEWQAVFGNTTPSSGAAYMTQDSQETSDFMPSNLLDMAQHMQGLNLGGQAGGQAAQMPYLGKPGAAQKPAKPGQEQPAKKGQKDMSAWFNLFADLDPLANPDDIGKRPEDLMGGQL